MNELPSIQSLAGELYSYLAGRFPVCCASDEFVFFPQAVAESKEWDKWDDFSPDSVEDAVLFLRALKDKASRCNGTTSPGSPRAEALVSLLKWVASTLEEQFTDVRSHSTQPTFTLTLVVAGLLEALDSGDKRSWTLRIKTLPLFLEESSKWLTQVPALCRDLGVKMAEEILDWLPMLGQGADVGRALRAVGLYRDRLLLLNVIDSALLPVDLVERIVKHHTGSGLTIEEALAMLQEEVSDLRRQLTSEAQSLGYGDGWEAAFRDIEAQALPPGGKIALVRQELFRLREHCSDLGIRVEAGEGTANLDVEYLPPSLSSIRAADSYNARPGYPYKGGTFYIYAGGTLGRPSSLVHPVYRMTVAHEAYPGHHLLDLSRWNNSEAALRPLEHPLFYEGWACFCEDLMLATGALDLNFDRLILLRRRFRHAVRGVVDLKIHSGKAVLGQAATELFEAGFERSRAYETARKYALRPAYQMCYTVGRRFFQRLFKSYGQEDVPGFVNTVLQSGELLFEDLERVLETPGEGEGANGRGGESPVSE